MCCEHSRASEGRAEFPPFASPLTSSCEEYDGASSAPLPLWCPPLLAHFSLACHPFVWLCHVFCQLCQTLSLSSLSLSLSHPLYALTLQLVTELVPVRLSGGNRWRRGTQAALTVSLSLWLTQFCFQTSRFWATFQAGVQREEEPPARWHMAACLNKWLSHFFLGEGLPGSNITCVVIFYWPRLSPDVPTAVLMHNPHAHVHMRYIP